MIQRLAGRQRCRLAVRSCVRATRVKCVPYRHMQRAGRDVLGGGYVGGKNSVSAGPDQAQACEAHYSRHCNKAEFHIVILLFNRWTTDWGVGFASRSPQARRPNTACGSSRRPCQEPMGVPVCCQGTPIKECPVGAVQTGRVAIPRLGEPQHLCIETEVLRCSCSSHWKRRVLEPCRR